jgi:hypothetical protein
VTLPNEWSFEHTDLAISGKPSSPTEMAKQQQQTPNRMIQITQIPNSIARVGTAAAAALDGAINLGATINLEHNNAGAIGTDYHRMFGDPNATVPALRLGKQGEYLEAKAQATTATADQRAAVEAGQDFFVASIDLLRNFCGRKWNSSWSAAGFTFGSLAVPKEPRSALLELRAHFLVHPERESVERNVSAARAQTLIAQLDAARQNVGAKEAAKKAAKQARDEAFEKLRERLRDLRGELDLLLEDDDSRWYQFGFRRPIDGRMPSPVEGLVVRAGAAGEVIAEWRASTRALNYRVKRAVVGVNSEPIEVGLFTDLTATIHPLPSGATLRVEVSSRNASGETDPAHKTIVVP